MQLTHTQVAKLLTYYYVTLDDRECATPYVRCKDGAVFFKTCGSKDFHPIYWDKNTFLSATLEDDGGIVVQYKDDDGETQQVLIYLLEHQDKKAVLKNMNSIRMEQ